MREKQIKGFEGYTVSADGTVRGKAGNILKTQHPGNRLASVTLYKREGNRVVGYSRSVAKLVAEAFIPKSDPSLTVIKHKDGDRFNNNVDNLQWQAIAERMFDIDRSSIRRPMTVTHMYNGKQWEIRSVADVARFMEQGYPEKTEKQHFRSINHYLSFKPRFVIYLDYKLHFSEIELTEEEKNFNFKKYRHIDTVATDLDLTKSQLKTLINRYNVRTFSQKNDTWVNLYDISSVMDKVAKVNGVVYYKDDYNLDIDFNKRDSRNYSNKIEVTLVNRLNDKVYHFDTMTLCAEYVRFVMGRNMDSVLSSLSKRLKRGSDYLFFSIYKGYTDRNGVLLRDDNTSKPCDTNVKKKGKKYTGKRQDHISKRQFKTKEEEQDFYRTLHEYALRLPDIRDIPKVNSFTVSDVSSLLSIPMSVLSVAVTNGVLEIEQRKTPFQYSTLGNTQLESFIKCIYGIKDMGAEVTRCTVST